ncbi:MAG: hypothetical protein JNN30_12895 [Rhodanobacteraceae bacterium]|nr:hypothetical protein [Rhodanobacteraceae bacterium]
MSAVSLMPDKASPVPVLHRLLSQIIPFVLVWLFALVCHAMMILLFSQSLPISDQWDSEGFLLIRPWLEGHLSWAQLFDPHNEHRIFTKRVFDLAVLSLNGAHWDNRVTALANAGIYAAAVATCFVFVRRTTEGLTRRVLQMAVLALPLMTANFENTLWGFQSPFYFSCLFAVFGFQHVARNPALPAFGAPLLVASAGAILSLASGLLLPLALAVLLALDRRPGCSRLRRAGVIAMLLAVAVIGYAVLPKLPPENTVMARSIGEAATAALRVLSWPIPLLPLAWLPLLAWLALALKRRRTFCTADLFFLGLAGWVVLQALATGYGRGQGLVAVPWRYTDALLYGLLANVYFACRLVAEAPPRLLRWSTAASVGMVWLVVGAYLALVSAQSVYVMLQTLRIWQTRGLVLAALLRNEPVAADNPGLPYPHLSKMPLFLGSATLRSALGVDGERLRDSCDVAASARLSRLVCTLWPSTATSPLPQFRATVALPEETPPSRCNLDYLGGRTPDGSITRGSPLRLDGWVGPSAQRLLPMFGTATVFLVSDGNVYAANSEAITPRPDVAAFVADPRYHWSAFSLHVGTANVAPGSYAIYLRAEDAAPCRTEQIVEVR